jgi:hypothetical protein
MLFFRQIWVQVQPHSYSVAEQSPANIVPLMEKSVFDANFFLIASGLLEPAKAYHQT